MLNIEKISHGGGMLALLLCLGLTACASDLPSQIKNYDASSPIVFGRVISEIAGHTTRIYPPQVRFFELMNRETKDRVQVLIESDDRTFSLQVAPGEYELTRVQVSEGPFMSMADYAIGFELGQGRLYVGTWKFLVDIPRYGRMMSFSADLNEEARTETERQLFREAPDARDIAVTDVALSPSHAEARLYEVMPYPRYPRYFRRHWW